MRTSSLALGICAALVLLSGLSSASFAQNREKFGISAKAGGVNIVTGHVVVKRASQKSEQDLTDRDDLKSGDVVSTDASAQVEVLLNPGSYLRVTGNSAFEVSDNSLANLNVRLIKGSAIIEATGTDDAKLNITILTPQLSFLIGRRGVYRINMIPPSTTELLVQKGAVVLEGQAAAIKGGTKVSFTKGSPVTAKLTKSERDEFDAWSKTRAETLARANQKLSIRTLNSYLSASNLDWPTSPWSIYGLWAFSPFARCFTFFPFYNGWGSPYGVGYGRSGWLFYDFYSPCCSGPTFDPVCCRGRVNPPIIVSNPPFGSSGGYGGSSGGYGGSSGGPSGGSPSGGSSGGPSGGSIGNSRPPSPPSPPSPPPSQAGPRDPGSGGGSPGKIRDPID